MQLADMAKDYYTLKRAYPMAVEWGYEVMELWSDGVRWLMSYLGK
jgi:hypothetical protein